jgi:hypothetical protein
MLAELAVHCDITHAHNALLLGRIKHFKVLSLKNSGRELEHAENRRLTALHNP